MKSVFIVTDGFYSDMSVVGVFSTEELAKSFIARACKYGTVQEMTVDDEDMVSDLIPYRVTMDIDGDNAVVEPWDWEASSDGRVYKHWRPLDPGSTIKASSPIVRTVSTRVRARDETHAIKIANERRAMYLANNVEVE